MGLVSIHDTYKDSVTPGYSEYCFLHHPSNMQKRGNKENKENMWILYLRWKDMKKTH